MLQDFSSSLIVVTFCFGVENKPVEKPQVLENPLQRSDYTAWDTMAMMKLWRRDVVSSIPDRGTIAGQVFSPTRQLARFSHLNVPFFQNS